MYEVVHAYSAKKREDGSPFWEYAKAKTNYNVNKLKVGDIIIDQTIGVRYVVTNTTKNIVEVLALEGKVVCVHIIGLDR